MLLGVVDTPEDSIERGNVLLVEEVPQGNLRGNASAEPRPAISPALLLREAPPKPRQAPKGPRKPRAAKPPKAPPGRETIVEEVILAPAPLLPPLPPMPAFGSGDDAVLAYNDLLRRQWWEAGEDREAYAVAPAGATVRALMARARENTRLKCLQTSPRRDEANKQQRIASPERTGSPPPQQRPQRQKHMPERFRN